jgi:hypothetical protein
MKKAKKSQMIKEETVLIAIHENPSSGQLYMIPYRSR